VGYVSGRVLDGLVYLHRERKQVKKEYRMKKSKRMMGSSTYIVYPSIYICTQAYIHTYTYLARTHIYINIHIVYGSCSLTAD
jgi:hypothetical protein